MLDQVKLKIKCPKHKKIASCQLTVVKSLMKTGDEKLWFTVAVEFNFAVKNNY